MVPTAAWKVIQDTEGACISTAHSLSAYAAAVCCYRHREREKILAVLSQSSKWEEELWSSWVMASSTRDEPERQTDGGSRGGLNGDLGWSWRNAPLLYSHWVDLHTLNKSTLTWSREDSAISVVADTNKMNSCHSVVTENKEEKAIGNFYTFILITW